MDLESTIGIQSRRDDRSVISFRPFRLKGLKSLGNGWLRPFARYGPTGPRIGGFALNVPNEFGTAMGAPG